MRWGIAAFLAGLLAAFAAPAAAQSRIAIDAAAPVVTAEINGRPVRLEVDLRLPDVLALSPEAAERLRVRRVPLLSFRVGIEGSNTTIGGRIARPSLIVDGRSSRAFAGIFPAPVSSRADGVIGPGALPHDVVVVRLGPEPPQARTLAFALEDPDIWRVAADVGGQRLQVLFDIAGQASVFNRSAARAFDAAGAIPAAGDLIEAPLILGLSTRMQPVTTSLTFAGLALAPALARTNAPLLGATEPDALVVVAETEAPPPSVIVGRGALSRCSSIEVDRPARQLRLRCAP